MIDYDRPQALSKSVRTARKQHHCGECNRCIEPGERYQYVSGIWDGAPSSHKTCTHCVQGADLLLDECDGYLFGGVIEDLRDHVSEALPWSMRAARIVVGAKRKWRRFDGGGLMAVSP